MADERPFDLLRRLNRELEPRSEFADRLFLTLISEAGLAGPPTARGRWRLSPGWLPALSSPWRIIVVLLLLLALLSIGIVVSGTLLRAERSFTERTVVVTDITASSGWSIDTLASEGAVGELATLAYQGGGQPVVAYYDASSGSVVLAWCSDASCSSLGPAVEAGPTVTGLATVGGYLALGPGGEAWIARSIRGPGGDADGQVELQRLCPGQTDGCEPLEPMNVGTGDVATIHVRADGRPVVLFGSLGDDTSHLLFCGDPACRTGNATATVPTWPAEQDFALASDGLPLVVTSHNEALTLVTCLDDACARVATTDAVDGRQPRIALDSRGRPVIAALVGRSVILYRCADATCIGGTKSSMADLGPKPSGADEMVRLDLEMTPDDRPFVSLAASGELSLLACATSECTEATKVNLEATSPAQAAPHAMGLDGDGLPFVVYGVRSDLKVARCVTQSCLTTAGGGSGAPSSSGGNASAGPSGPSTLLRTAVDEIAGAYSPAVSVGHDGYPVAVFAAGDGSLHVLHCGDARCATGNTISTLTADGPAASAIAIDPLGLPVVAHVTWAGSLSVARCADPACSNAAPTSPLRGAQEEFVAIAVPPDDRPVVAFVSDSDGGIRIARCSTPACNAVDTVRIDANPDGWLVNSLELRLATDGTPVLGYALVNGEAGIARCDDLACVSPAVVPAGTKGNDMTTASLGIGPDGVPLLAFYSDASLLVARCRDEACASITTVRLDAATAGWWSPVGVGFDAQGLPVVAYYSPTNLDTKLARCHDAACSSADLIALDMSDANGADDATGITFLPDGSPVFVYVRDPIVYTETCSDPTCGA